MYNNHNNNNKSASTSHHKNASAARKTVSRPDINGYPVSLCKEKCISLRCDRDLCPSKPFQHCPLTRGIFVASFTEIRPLITEISGKIDGRTMHNRWTDNGWTDGRI